MSDADEILGDCPTCGMPYALEDERMMKSSDPTGYAIVRFYRCVLGDHWVDCPGMGVPDDE